MTEKQTGFFDPDLPVWENYDPNAEALVAKVVFSDGPDGEFDYKVPERLRDRIAPGMRVLAPLGARNRSVVAYCVALEKRAIKEVDVPPRAHKRPASKSDATPTLFDIPEDNSVKSAESATEPATRKSFRIKEISKLVDQTPLLSDKALEMARWLSKRYLCPLGQTLDGILPSCVRDAIGARTTSVCTLANDVDARLKRVDSEKKQTLYDQLTPKQRYCLDELRRAAEPPTTAELARMAKCSTAPIVALKNLGLIVMKRTRRTSRFYDELANASKSTKRVEPHELNPDQQNALDSILDAIRNGRNDVFLLHGATGSGKTEVYIDAIEEVVSYGKQAIVLVPEISLTPQTVQRFRARLGDVAVLHSRLTELERKAEWDKIANGRAQVVVGARSAIFAPCKRLGLIVIDEEHETSFKQDVAPRYHARVVARYRAEQDKAPLVLGSATPSLESWRNAQLGGYKLLSLPRRVRDLPQPPVYAVDMRERVASGFTRGALCERLCRDIELALDDDPKNQIILLLNRRGYSTHIQCPSCGETLKCPNCDVALTHHITQQIAICHYCDYQIPAPRECPYCKFAGIKYGGFGTQRLEQEFGARFPNAPILRMDSDTTQAKDAHERALEAFQRGDYRVLLGTQMIAKGLDFPNVVLVGIVNADAALYLPDFRAPERVFNLILQAAGRAGRGDKEGKVVVQTYCPDHPAIMAAIQGDYVGFAEAELASRRALGYPPFFASVRFVIRGPDEDETREFANALAETFKRAVYEINLERGYDQKNPPPAVEPEASRDAAGRNVVSLGGPRRPRPPLLVRALGPAPAPFAKLRGAYRFHLQTMGAPGDLLREAARRVMEARDLKRPRDVQWIVDVDPLDAL